MVKIEKMLEIRQEAVFLLKKMRYIGNTPDLAKLKEFAKIQG